MYICKNEFLSRWEPDGITFFSALFFSAFFLYTLLGDFGSNSAFGGRSLFDLGRFFWGEIMKLLE